MNKRYWIGEDYHIVLGGDYMEKRRIKLNCVVYKEDESYVSWCRDLDISSFGDTEQEAKDSLLEALDLYIQYAMEEKKLEELVFNKINSDKPSYSKVKNKSPFRPTLNVGFGEIAICR